MATRREARERALALCYESETKDEPVESVLAELPAPPDDYTITLVRGVGDHQTELDELLRTYSERWAVDRMPAVDRNLSRIAVYEIVFRDDIDDAVAVSEAVELAEELSTDNSPRFLNGLLARIAEYATP